MKILLTNDDGVNSLSLKILKEILEKAGWDVTVVAPIQEESGAGHRITIFRHLQLKEIYNDGKFFGYALSGSPADCVKFAVNEIFSKEPDIVISGINRGYNLGTNILYSGTVAAAIEASFMNIPAIAVSSCFDLKEMDIKGISEFIVKCVKWRLNSKIPNDTVLNINIPAGNIKNVKGIKITRQGKLYYQDYFKIEEKTNQKLVINVGDKIKDPENDLKTDSFALKSGYISITPLHFDLTDYETVKKLSEIDINIDNN